MKRSRKKATNRVFYPKYVKTQLPVHGLGLSTFIPSACLTDHKSFANSVITFFKKLMTPLLRTTDRFSEGNEVDAHIDGVFNLMEDDRERSAVLQKHHAKQIDAEQHLRSKQLEKRKQTLEERLDEKVAERKTYGSDLHREHEITIGSRSFPAGAIVTAVLSCVDICLHFISLQTKIVSAWPVLVLSLLGFAIFSNVSMSILASLRNRADANSAGGRLVMNKEDRLLSGVCILMFLLSSAASVVLKISTIDAIISTEEETVLAYTFGDYFLVTFLGLLTAGTGIISYHFSRDKNARKIAICEKLDARIAELRAQIEELEDEILSLQHTEVVELTETMINNDKQTYRDLRTDCKLEMRRLKAELEKSPDVTDRMADSAQEVLDTAAKADQFPAGAAPSAAAGVLPVPAVTVYDADASTVPAMA